MNVPGRIWALVSAAVIMLALLAFTAHHSLAHSRDGLRVIGHGAGPTVTATGDLYSALADMDAQLSRVLLGDAKASATFRSDRDQADQALLRAVGLPSTDTETRQMARSVLNALGRYDTLAERAILSHSLPAYRSATMLMKERMLPQAYNITLASGTVVRRAYSTERSAMLTGRNVLLGGGVALVLLLCWLQVYLAREFRRVANAGVFLATAGVIAGVTLATLTLGHEADLLSRAKQDGFDSLLTLSRAKAMSIGASAEETRSVLDPSSADVDESAFLDASQRLLYIAPEPSVGAVSLADYQRRVGTAVADPAALGLLGEEARSQTGQARPAAIHAVLTAYAGFQREDARLRAAGSRTLPSSTAFAGYDDALGALYRLHDREFRRTVADGDRLLHGWTAGPPVAAVVLAGMVLLGVRPRLAEYR